MLVPERVTRSAVRGHNDPDHYGRGGLRVVWPSDENPARPYYGERQAHRESGKRIEAAHRFNGKNRRRLAESHSRDQGSHQRQAGRMKRLWSRFLKWHRNLFPSNTDKVLDRHRFDQRREAARSVVRTFNQALDDLNMVIVMIVRGDEHCDGK